MDFTIHFVPARIRKMVRGAQAQKNGETRPQEAAQ
jgi:hypothetical protein